MERRDELADFTNRPQVAESSGAGDFLCALGTRMGTDTSVKVWVDSFADVRPRSLNSTLLAIRQASEGT